MIKSRFLLYTLLIISFLYPLDLPGPFDQKDLEKGILLIQNGHFDEASLSFKKIRDSYPERPEGYMLLSLLYSICMNYYKTFHYTNEFYYNVTNAIDYAKEYGKKAPKDEKPYYYFYRGGAIGYRGIQKMREGDFFKSFFDGSKGVKIFKKVIKLNPDLTDAYYGLGQYHYYKSYYSRMFKWLPFVSDDKEIAFSYMNKVVQNGYFLKIESLLAYITLKIYEEDVEALKDLIMQYKNKFPGNIFLNYKLLDYYLLIEDHKSISTVADETITMLDTNPISGPAAYIRIYYQHALALYGLKEYDKAKTLIEKQQSYTDKIENCFKDKEFLDKGNKLLKKIVKEIN
ncbi:tetratricopeptide repeat protein [Spirochaetota bacterium]